MSAGRYVEYAESADGGWYWRLRAANHETLAIGETYRDRTDAERGARAAFPDLFPPEETV